MTVYKRVSGAWVSTTPKKRVSGTMVNATSLLVRVSGAWVQKLQLVKLTSQTISDSQPSGSFGDATAQYGLQSNGEATRFPFFISSVIPGEWGSGLAGAGYEVMFDTYSGAAPATGSAARGTWLSLSTSRHITLTYSAAFDGSKSASFRVRIRAAGTTEILATATINLRAEKGIAG